MRGRAGGAGRGRGPGCLGLPLPLLLPSSFSALGLSLLVCNVGLGGGWARECRSGPWNGPHLVLLLSLGALPRPRTNQQTGNCQG